MLTAKKNVIKSTVLEHLSGRPPLCGNNCFPNSINSLPMIILVGPPKTRKKYFLNQIFMKHADKFYQAFIYTTNNLCINKMYKKITIQNFNKMNCLGKFIFSYQFFGHSYALGKKYKNNYAIYMVTVKDDNVKNYTSFNYAGKFFKKAYFTFKFILFFGQ